MPQLFGLPCGEWRTKIQAEASGLSINRLAIRQRELTGRNIENEVPFILGILSSKHQSREIEFSKTFPGPPRRYKKVVQHRGNTLHPKPLLNNFHQQHPINPPNSAPNLQHWAKGQRPNAIVSGPRACKDLGHLCPCAMLIHCTLSVVCMCVAGFLGDCPMQHAAPPLPPPLHIHLTGSTWR